MWRRKRSAKQAGQAGVANQLSLDQRRRRSMRSSKSLSKRPEKKMLAVQDRFKSSREAYAHYDKGSSTAGNNNPVIIPLVPKALREKEELKKYFEPTLISIGPYHHGKENLKAGELIKLRWAEEFLKIQRKGEENKEKLLDSIRGEIKELRACYDATDHVKEDKYDDETLTWMLLVDGCSVLHYMCCCLFRILFVLNLNNSDLAILQQDLILLENQLPYRVLILLNDFISGGEGSIMKLVDDFVRSFIYETPERELKWRPWSRFFGKQRRPSKPIFGEPSHLLWTLQRQYTAGDSTESDRLSQLLSSFALSLFEEEPGRRSFFFHNVTELTAKGIRLEPLCVGHVAFHDRYGFVDVAFHDDNPFLNPQLLLRPITVDGETKRKLLNVIALEMSSSSKRRYVTSYICFLNSLITNQADVKELKEAHILSNCLGSNEELAKFFKGIADNLVSDFEIYNDVLSRIDKYLNSRRSNIWSWKTEATRTYLQSPWKAIAVFAGFLAISVSIVQTYFTIFPLPDKCNESICNYISKKNGFGG